MISVPIGSCKIIMIGTNIAAVAIETKISILKNTQQSICQSWQILTYWWAIFFQKEYSRCFDPHLMFYMSFLMFWSRRIYQCSICLSWFFNPYLYQSSICLSRCFDHYLYTNVLHVFPGVLIPTSIPKFNMSFPVFGSLLSQLVQFKTYKWIITWTARITL